MPFPKGGFAAKNAARITMSFPVFRLLSRHGE